MATASVAGPSNVVPFPRISTRAPTISEFGGADVIPFYCRPVGRYELDQVCADQFSLGMGSTDEDVASSIASMAMADACCACPGANREDPCFLTVNGNNFELVGPISRILPEINAEFMQSVVCAVCPADAFSLRQQDSGRACEEVEKLSRALERVTAGVLRAMTGKAA